MNIFVLDTNPVKAAEQMCDKHIVKMIIESCQMLSAAIDVNCRKDLRPTELSPSQQLGLPQYPKAHLKHPCTEWVCKSRGNYNWLLRHLRALNFQYYKRYNKIHALEGCCTVYDGQRQWLSFDQNKRTTFVQAMPDRYKSNDPVQAYRQYYIYEKFTFAKWKMGNKPEWFYEPIVYLELEAA